ncbi:MAG: sulfatase-like hydrolase/transferase [Acidaminococcaceae bacterium]
MRAKQFLHNLQQDFKVFIYLNALLMVLRIAFLYLFASQLAQVSAQEIGMSLWYGLRISMKTAGLLTLIGAVLSTLPQLVLRRWPAACLRQSWHSLGLVLLTLAFFTRIPYYKIFNSGFNLMLINGAKDDWHAIYITAVQQYQLWPRLAGVVLVSVGLVWMLRQVLATSTWAPRHKRWLAVLLAVFVLPFFMIFVRFGGGYSYDSGIHWESAARLKSHLLNEAILDDGQALYRVYAMQTRLMSAAQVEFKPGELARSLTLLQGQTGTGDVDSALVRTAQGAKLATPPVQIFFLFGENYALWPLLPRYAALSLTTYGNQFAHSEQGATLPNFLSNSGGTMTSLKGLISGLVDTGFYENYEAETYRTHYATGLGNIMKKLGYKTCFWYGGSSEWQDISKFVLSQGFDEFYGANTFGTQAGGVWGVDDATLFAQISKYSAAHQGEQLFHFVLTTSNHPPYALDVDALGFPRQKVAAKLPPTISSDTATLNQLGHIWYADQVQGKFITQMKAEQPASLFIITGDHAERFSFAQEEALQALSAVPCIFYGQGVQPDLFNGTTTGSQVQIIPTLVELVAPAGYRYSSLLPSLLDATYNISFNHRLWGAGLQIGELSTIGTAQLSASQRQQIQEQAAAAKLVAAWRIKQGNKI